MRKSVIRTAYICESIVRYSRMYGLHFVCKKDACGEE